MDLINMLNDYSNKIAGELDDLHRELSDRYEFDMPVMINDELRYLRLKKIYKQTNDLIKNIKELDK